MYIRASTRRNKNGETVRYLQLAHDEWDAAAASGYTVTVAAKGPA